MVLTGGGAGSKWIGYISKSGGTASYVHYARCVCVRGMRWGTSRGRQTLRTQLDDGLYDDADDCRPISRIYPSIYLEWKRGGKRRRRDNNKRVTHRGWYFSTTSGINARIRGYKGARSGWHDLGRNARKNISNFTNLSPAIELQSRERETEREREREWEENGKILANSGWNKKSERGEKNGGRIEERSGWKRSLNCGE